MKHKAIVWDVDDVLTPTSICFQESVIRTHGSCPHPSGWDDYLWGKHIGLDDGRETQNYLRDHRILETTVPYDYTQSALSLTHQVGYKNIILSARDWHPDPMKVTHDWASQGNFNQYIEAMFFSTVEKTKGDYLRILNETYDIKAFVDDNPHHAISAISIVPNIYLVRHGWNEEYRSVPHFNSVNTALEAAEHIVNNL